MGLVHFIETIKKTKMEINWASILNENLDEKLVVVKNNHKSYITSYLMYLLAVRETDYLR